MRALIHVVLLGALLVSSVEAAWAADADDEAEPAPRKRKKKRARAEAEEHAEPAAPPPTEKEPPKSWGDAARAAFTEVPWHTGLMVDVLGGFSAFPSSANRNRINLFRFGGVRLGMRRDIRFLAVGAEVAWRSTLPMQQGTQTFLLNGPLSRLTGGTPQQVIRQENQVALGGTVGAQWRKMEFHAEVHALGGATVSAQTVIIGLERALPYNHSFITLGPYLGAGWDVGLDPIFVRMDAWANYQVGPPPFGTQLPYLGYNIAAGVHW